MKSSWPRKPENRSAQCDSVMFLPRTSACTCLKYVARLFHIACLKSWSRWKHWPRCVWGPRWSRGVLQHLYRQKCFYLRATACCHREEPHMELTSNTVNHRLLKVLHDVALKQRVVVWRTKKSLREKFQRTCCVLTAPHTWPVTGRQGKLPV